MRDLALRLLLKMDTTNIAKLSLILAGVFLLASASKHRFAKSQLVTANPRDTMVRRYSTDIRSSDDDFKIDIRSGGEDDEDDQPQSNHTCCVSRQDSLKPVQLDAVGSSSGTRRGCGRRQLTGLGFRVLDDDDGADNEAQFGEFPWTVAVFRDVARLEYITYHCGGSLIHPAVVLTAAHCVYTIPVGELLLRAGEWDMQSTAELLPHEERRVQRKLTHPRYSKGTLASDIALLFVAAPFGVEAANIGTICLPAQSQRFDGERCVASGWGKNGAGSGARLQTVLKSVELPIVEAAECERRLQQTRLGRRWRLHETFVCAGGERGRDTCDGDGGSPLVCGRPTVRGSMREDDEERYYQVGIVAWGIGCGGESPAVYVNVAEFRHWIDGHMVREGYDAASYTAH